MEILLTQSQKILFYNGFLLGGLLIFYWRGWHYGRSVMPNKSLWINTLSWMMRVLWQG